MNPDPVKPKPVKPEPLSKEERVEKLFDTLDLTMRQLEELHLQVPPPTPVQPPPSLWTRLKQRVICLFKRN